MTYQEILEGVIRHRMQQIASVDQLEIQRKVNELEWALQSILEKLRDHEDDMEHP